MDRWTLAAAITDGRVFRRMNRHGRITGGSLSDEGVYLVVGTYPPQICLWLAPLTHGGRLPRWCTAGARLSSRSRCRQAILPSRPRSATWAWSRI